jgi:hypothetical protein
MSAAVFLQLVLLAGIILLGFQYKGMENVVCICYLMYGLQQLHRQGWNPFLSQFLSTLHFCCDLIGIPVAIICWVWGERTQRVTAFVNFLGGSRIEQRKLLVCTNSVVICCNAIFLHLHLHQSYILTMSFASLSSSHFVKIHKQVEENGTRTHWCRVQCRNIAF